MSNAHEKIDDLMKYCHNHQYNRRENLGKLFRDDYLLDRLFTIPEEHYINNNMVLAKDIANGDEI